MELKFRVHYLLKAVFDLTQSYVQIAFWFLLLNSAELHPADNADLGQLDSVCITVILSVINMTYVVFFLDQV